MHGEQYSRSQRDMVGRRWALDHPKERANALGLAFTMPMMANCSVLVMPCGWLTHWRCLSTKLDQPLGTGARRRLGSGHRQGSKRFENLCDFAVKVASASIDSNHSPLYYSIFLEINLMRRSVQSVPHFCFFAK